MLHFFNALDALLSNATVDSAAVHLRYGTSFVIDILLKFSAIFNSSSNSLFLYSCSKFFIFFVICAREANNFT